MQMSMTVQWKQKQTRWCSWRRSMWTRWRHYTVHKSFRWKIHRKYSNINRLVYYIIVINSQYTVSQSPRSLHKMACHQGGTVCCCCSSHMLWGRPGNVPSLNCRGWSSHRSAWHQRAW